MLSKFVIFALFNAVVAAEEKNEDKMDKEDENMTEEDKMDKKDEEMTKAKAEVDLESGTPVTGAEESEIVADIKGMEAELEEQKEEDEATAKEATAEETAEEATTEEATAEEATGEAKTGSAAGAMSTLFVASLVLLL